MSITCSAFECKAQYKGYYCILHLQPISTYLNFKHTTISTSKMKQMEMGW